MSALRKFVQLSAVAAFVVIVTFLRKLNTQEEPKGQPRPTNHQDLSSDTFRRRPDDNVSSLRAGNPFRSEAQLRKPESYPGGESSSGLNSRVLVLPRMNNENISWVADELPDLDVVVYVADDPFAPLHPPKNKGHEVMIYLTYIIDHYNVLPDIVIFMHAHRWTHHNNDLLGHDAVEMIQRLKSDRVMRDGYVNMRCQWEPGCPEWLHPEDVQERLDKQEEQVLSECWGELFPLEPIPQVLGQPCCAQFAISKERVLSISLSRFIFYRDWIMRTPLSDYVSGRIWEYTWQFLFTGQSIMCPPEHICYCDGFGLCFGGDAAYRDFERLRSTKKGYEMEVARISDMARLNDGTGKGRIINGSSVEAEGREPFSYRSNQIEALDREILARRSDAIRRGNSSKNRAVECGRLWEGPDEV